MQSKGLFVLFYCFLFVSYDKLFHGLRLYIVGSSQIPIIIIAVEGCTIMKTCSLLVLRDARFWVSNGPRTKSERSPNKVRT